MDQSKLGAALQNSISEPINIIIFVLLLVNILCFLAIFFRAKYALDLIEKTDPLKDRQDDPARPGKSYLDRLRDDYETWVPEYKALVPWVHLYYTFMNIFPYLGILGTVVALLSIHSDFSKVDINFLLALTSTFWGLVGAIISSILYSFFAPKFEQLKSYFEMLTRDKLQTGSESLN
ncbi:MotA/TolQ/ExbB proton channel family protein [Candidatus Riflebacteria bacterium]